MKIRKGFVTNSSSTNFLIISKHEVTFEYLFDKMTGGKSSIFDEEIKELCITMMDRIERVETIKKEDVQEKFGVQVEKIYESFKKDGCFIYIGSTEDSDPGLASFFTLYPMEIKTNDFYLNALNSIY